MYIQYMYMHVYACKQTYKQTHIHTRCSVAITITWRGARDSPTTTYLPCEVCWAAEEFTIVGCLAPGWDLTAGRMLAPCKELLLCTRETPGPGGLGNLGGCFTPAYRHWLNTKVGAKATRNLKDYIKLSLQSNFKKIKSTIKWFLSRYSHTLRVIWKVGLLCTVYNVIH